MKKSIWLLILLFFVNQLFAQSETEPNNDFSSANFINQTYGSFVSGSVGNSDPIDYFHSNFTTGWLNTYKQAGYRLKVEVTNTGTVADNFVVAIHNHLKELGKAYEFIIEDVAPGTTVTKNIELNGKKLEELFFSFAATELFTYSFEFYISDAYSDTEPNDTRATATTYVLNTVTYYAHSIGYSSLDSTETDEIDYFRFLLSDADIANSYISIKAKNISGINGKWLRYELFRNEETTALTSGYIGSAAGVPMWTEITQSLYIGNYGLTQSDNIIIRLTTDGVFGYDFLNEETTPGFSDPEDNCCVYNAVPLTENVYSSGNIGTYEYLYDEEYEYGYYNYLDEYDTYRIVLPQAGAIKLFIEATNMDCPNSYVDLQYDLLDKYGNIIYDYREIFNWMYNPCDATLTDIIKLRAFSADTFYIRLHSHVSAESATQGTPVHYKIKYQFLDATDNVDEEYNDTQATALPIEENQVVKGNIQFKGVDYDDADYYKMNLSGLTNITGHVTITYRGEDQQAYQSSVAYIHFPALNYVARIPLNPPGGMLLADSVYTQTFEICGLPPGENFFYFSSGYGEPFEYEFRFEKTNTVPWQNDTLSSNTRGSGGFLAEGEEYSGTIGFREGQQSYVNQYDYYRIVLKKSGNIRVNVELKNPTCNLTGVTAYLGLQNTGQQYTKLQTLTSGLAPGASINEVIEFCGIQADTLIFYINHTFLSAGYTSPYTYKISYEVVDTVTEEFTDTEPNNTFSEAIFVQDGEVKKGAVGYSQDIDYYKFYAVADTIKIPFVVTNKFCGNDYVIVRAFSATQTLIASRRIGLNVSMAPGETISDLFKFYNASPDTVYLQINNPADKAEAMLYSFTLNPQPPSSSFVLEGDNTACYGEKIYKALNIADNGITYHWSLPDGGGSISFTDSTATVNWNGSGNRRVALYLTNEYGQSETRYFNVLVNNDSPTQIPVIYQSGRKLFTQQAPIGATYQWYLNENAISGAADSFYTAVQQGSYTVKFSNQCGAGPASNAIVFSAVAQNQTISFPTIPNTVLVPGLKIKLPATAGSGLPVQYIKISGAGIIQNDTLYISGSGTLTGDIVIKAVQLGDINWMPANDVTQTLRILKGEQNISFAAIGNQLLNDSYFNLTASSSAGLGISYSIITGNTLAQVYGNNQLRKTGVGTVTVRASQNGNSNYNAAPAVERTFCIGLPTLSAINGEGEPCSATYRYTTTKIPGAQYVWSLSGGGTITTNNDTAWVQWSASSGSYQLSVKANSSCDATYSNEIVKEITISNHNPGVVSNMIPVNATQTAGLPLRLSWIPASHTESYDIYIWDSTSSQPAAPYAANITGISYEIPQNALPYNTAYSWRVVAKNPCAVTAGLIQHFRLIPLPDLQVSNINLPPSANSGQTVTISWQVSNNGPGNTLTSQEWKDAVFLSVVPNPDFRLITTNQHNWPNPVSPNSPLLIGTQSNITALDNGEHYTNNIDFSLPVQYQNSLYAHVITDYGTRVNLSPLQVTKSNDTLSTTATMNVTRMPTPDLRVEHVFTPSTVFSGNTFNITYQVKNYGVITPAASNWNDSIFISQSPVFDRQNSIALMAPKAANNYYPNTVEATVYNSSILEANDIYTRNVNVVIPNFIMGQWYVYVKTNANQKLYEGVLTENNMGQALLEVLLTPSPKLSIQNILLPITTASTTQPIGVNWEIKNIGFNDNYEKNKGHYLTTIGTCAIPCPPGTPPNSVCVTTRAVDSIGFGSSYWVDKIYLSNNPNILDTNTAIFLNRYEHGTSNAGLFVEDEYPECGSASARINVSHVLNPNAVFSASTAFTVPKNLPEGDYYVYIHTNAEKTVYEYPGGIEIKRSTDPIQIRRPDLMVNAIEAPANTLSGTEITINYSLTNQGAGALFNTLRTDKLYISNFPHFDANAVLVASQSYTETLTPNIPKDYNFQYKIPHSTTGTKYFYVVTNQDSLFKETNMLNNISAAASTAVVTAVPADLNVTNITVKDTITALYRHYVLYTVTNSGSGAISTNGWKDELFIGCTNTFTTTTAVQMGTRPQHRILPAGESYTDTIYFTIPEMLSKLTACFSTADFNEAYLYVKTNADSTAYEGTLFDNNISTAKTVIVNNPYVDHIVDTVYGTNSTIAVGSSVHLRWEIKNIGSKPAENYYNNENYDAVYLSTDSILSAEDDKVAEYRLLHRLEKDKKTLVHKAFNMPNVTPGEYYLLLSTNNNRLLNVEKNTTNNTNLVRSSNGNPVKIRVETAELPDLKDSSYFTQDYLPSGQPFTISQHIQNIGTGELRAGNIRNTIWLSANPDTKTNAVLLKSYTKNTTLQPDASLTETISVQLPSTTLSGTYFLITETNSDKAVVEVNYDNNKSVRMITVYTPSPADLVVEDIITPDTVYLGDPLPLQWKVKNIAENTAIGISADGVYLSKSPTFDSSALLAGVLSKTINISPLASATVNYAPVITNVIEGPYHLFVETDIQNNIHETVKENNRLVAAQPVYVAVKELRLNQVEASTLDNTSRFYKLQIPDELLGSTIRVQLKTADSLTKINEMFMAGGYIPTPANYDYRFSTPNYGNQHILITDASSNIYYLDVRTRSATAGIQNITLLAEVMPFSILNVNNSSGGNIGNVTVRIAGSLFTENMTATLKRQAQTITASAVYFSNSTEIYATFNLAGVPLGQYDVTLTKPDETATTLPNGFRVEPANNGGLITGSGANKIPGNGDEPGCDPGAASGMNSQLVIELAAPSSALLGTTIAIQISFSNPTNYDIPAQSRTLYAIEGIPLSFTKEGLAGAPNTLHLTITEPGGPPGVIRAGGSGTIIVFAQVPLGRSINPLPFNLK